MLFHQHSTETKNIKSITFYGDTQTITKRTLFNTKSASKSKQLLAHKCITSKRIFPKRKYTPSTDRRIAKSLNLDCRFRCALCCVTKQFHKFCAFKTVLLPPKNRLVNNKFDDGLSRRFYSFCVVCCVYVCV